MDPNIIFKNLYDLFPKMRYNFMCYYLKADDFLKMYDFSVFDSEKERAKLSDKELKEKKLLNDYRSELDKHLYPVFDARLDTKFYLDRVLVSSDILNEFNVVKGFKNKEDVEIFNIILKYIDSYFKECFDTYRLDYFKIPFLPVIHRKIQSVLTIPNIKSKFKDYILPFYFFKYPIFGITIRYNCNNFKTLYNSLGRRDHSYAVNNLVGSTGVIINRNSIGGSTFIRTDEFKRKNAVRKYRLDNKIDYALSKYYYNKVFNLFKEKYKKRSTINKSSYSLAFRVVNSFKIKVANVITFNRIAHHKPE